MNLIAEAVVNAVYHRGYDTREPVEIRIERDEMMIISYPDPDRSVRLGQLQAGRAQLQRYRNRRIGEFLKKLEFTEGRCTGIPKIIEAMAKNSSLSAEETRQYPPHSRWDKLCEDAAVETCDYLPQMLADKSHLFSFG